MAGWQIDHEPTLDEILHDDMMDQVVRSAGFETETFRAHLADLALRLSRGARTARRAPHREAA